MSDRPNCPKCGMPLPPDAPVGICPKCLLQAGFESEADAKSFTPPDLDQLAAQFPNLVFLKLLGRGGMGAVYHAKQKDLDRDVAVKILPPEVGKDPSFAARFTREARTLAKLNHPNIVQIYNFGQAGEYFYFVMEYVDGANLRQMVQAGGIEPRQALAIIPAICEALQFAHDSGVVHRDIKPENILVDQRGRVKIADFGLAMLLERAPVDVTLTGTHQVMGTPNYMAPEQMRGSRAIDHRADIYSLGVVFYELLTGELPVGHFDAPSKRLQIDVRLDEVVLRALATEPDRRYQHASDIQHDVEQISRSVPTGGAVAAAGHVRETQVEATPVTSVDSVSRHAWTPARLLLLVIANLWLLAAIVLMLGKKVARTEPLMYSFFEGGAWFYPSSYNSLVMLCAALSAACFLFALFRRREHSRRHRGDGTTSVKSSMTSTSADPVGTMPAGTPPRFSRQALLGAFWAPLFFINAFLMLTVTDTSTTRSGPTPIVRVERVNPQPGETEENVAGVPEPIARSSEVVTTYQSDSWSSADGASGSRTQKGRNPLQWLLLLTVLPLGLAAPFGTTILGVTAISTIRHSRGAIIGLPLAVADALFFPLLIMDGVLIVCAIYLLSAVTKQGISTALVLMLLLLPILALDFWIARYVWRRTSNTA